MQELFLFIILLGGLMIWVSNKVTLIKAILNKEPFNWSAFGLSSVGLVIALIGLSGLLK